MHTQGRVRILGTYSVMPGEKLKILIWILSVISLSDNFPTLNIWLPQEIISAFCSPDSLLIDSPAPAPQLLHRLYCFRTLGTSSPICLMVALPDFNALRVRQCARYPPALASAQFYFLQIKGICKGISNLRSAEKDAASPISNCKGAWIQRGENYFFCIYRLSR